MSCVSQRCEFVGGVQHDLCVLEVPWRAEPLSSPNLTIRDCKHVLDTPSGLRVCVCVCVYHVIDTPSGVQVCVGVDYVA